MGHKSDHWRGDKRSESEWSYGTRAGGYGSEHEGSVCRSGGIVLIYVDVHMHIAVDGVYIEDILNS